MDNGKSTALCPGCHQPIENGASYCTKCGTRVFHDSNGDSVDPYLGRTIDDTFDIEEIIGSGSMGVVYKARHRVLNCAVALKVLRQDFVTDRVILTRFQREAQAASALSHPNVIRIMHYGKTYLNAPYIAMECLNGTELSKLVSSQFPLNPRRACSIIYQTVQALIAAHAAGIIHRDLKPANIVIIEQNGQEVVKVLDFGIAKITDTESEGLTKEGSVCGTPAFMSPEQVVGKPVTPASDLFSLGSIIYYILTCKLPFQGASMVDMATSILTIDPTPPSQVRIDTYIDPHLEAICLKCLEKNLEFRYKTAADVARDLENAFNEIPEVAPDVRRKIVVGQIDENIDLSGKTCCEIPAMPDEEEEVEEGATVVDMQAMPDDDNVSTSAPKSSIGNAVSMVSQALSHVLSLDSVTIGEHKLAPNEVTHNVPVMPDELPGETNEEQIIAREALIQRRKRIMILIVGAVVFVCAIIVIVVAIVFSDSPAEVPEEPIKVEEPAPEEDPELKLSSLELYRYSNLISDYSFQSFTTTTAFGLVYGQPEEESQKSVIREKMDDAAALLKDGKKDKACSAYKDLLKEPELEDEDKASIQAIIKKDCTSSSSSSSSKKKKSGSSNKKKRRLL